MREQASVTSAQRDEDGKSYALRQQAMRRGITQTRCEYDVMFAALRAAVTNAMSLNGILLLQRCWLSSRCCAVLLR